MYATVHITRYGHVCYSAHVNEVWTPYSAHVSGWYVNLWCVASARSRNADLIVSVWDPVLSHQLT